MSISIVRLRRWAALAAVGFLSVAAAAPAARAHEIPTNVTVLAFIKPEGQRLRVLVRVPLESMRDFTFPQVPPGFLVFGDDLDFMLEQGAFQWVAGYLHVYEGGRVLPEPRLAAMRLSLPSDRSFTTYDEALGSVFGPPLPDDTELFWQQAMFDMLFEYDIQSESSDFAIDSELAHLGMSTLTILRFLPPGGAERIFQYSGMPGRVSLDPRWHQAALTFVRFGFEHILDGIDHLLFVLCLVIPFRRLLPIAAIVTAFTVAHSITLIASALGYAPEALWWPPLVETLIALSIVFMAFENIIGPKLQRRWLIAFGFGLIHGFGFSFALSESLQFAGAHLATSLLAFNVGVEIGQVLVVALSIPLLTLLFRHVVAERMGIILLSALVAHTSWHWMTERASTLALYDFQWPALDLVFLSNLLRWLMLALIAGGVAWLLYGVIGRATRTAPAPQTEPAPRRES